MSKDLETRVSEFAVDSLKLWLRLSTCSNLIQNELRNRLRITFNTTLPRFDLLAQLSSEPSGLKMGELSKRLMVSNGNITAITTQLENEGLISRIVDRKDRRSTYIKTTAKGKKSFSKMEKSYNAWVEELLGDLSAQSTKRAFKSLQELKTTVQAVINSQSLSD